MKIAYIAISITLFTLSCVNNQLEVFLTPLPKFALLDTSAKKEYRIDLFLIQNFTDTENSKKILDSICLNTNINYKNLYKSYQMVLYKTSEKTNEENLSRNPRDIDRYSQNHDMVYVYEWIDGKFIVRRKYNNGKIVEPGNSNNIQVLDSSN